MCAEASPVAGDALALLGRDRDSAMVFYAQAQLFQRFVRRDGSAWRERFEWWENECRGALVGSASTRRLGDPGPAAAAFDRVFGTDLDELERSFLDWLQEQ